MVARTERSPGFGAPLAFPVTQWLMSGVPDLAVKLPVTVAGPRRHFTGFRVAPFVISIVRQGASLGTPPARRKRGLELGLQSRSFSLVADPIRFGDLVLLSEIARVQGSDGRHQCIRRLD